MKRHDLLKAALALPALRLPKRAGRGSGVDLTRSSPQANTQAGAQRAATSADFVVVGSGAGGATVAARLVEAGFSVLVLEAGGDPSSAAYDIPAFHPVATEHEGMRWDFFVHHYSDPAKERTEQGDGSVSRAHHVILSIN